MAPAVLDLGAPGMAIVHLGGVGEVGLLLLALFRAPFSSAPFRKASLAPSHLPA